MTSPRNLPIVELAAAAALTLFSSGNAFAGVTPVTKEISSLGQAAIYSGDKAQARDRAVDDAMRKAVEQAVGAVVSSETITENFQLISDKIFSKSKGYVKKYKIISEKEKDGLYEVRIKATVSTAALSGDLDGILAILKAKNMPRVLIMVAEQNVGRGDSSFWWGDKNFAANLDAVENAFMNAWIPKGFTFVDRMGLAGKVRVGPALTSADPGESAIKEFATDSGAEIVIFGKAIAQDVGSIMGTAMHSIRANISVRVMNLDTGRIIATGTHTAVAGHIDPMTGGTKALTNVAKKTADDLLKKVMTQWQKEITGPLTVSITFSNVKKSRNLRDIKKFLSNDIRGVSAVRQRSYRSKVAKFEIDVKAKSEDVAMELEEKKFPGFTVEIEGITANTITASLK